MTPNYSPRYYGQALLQSCLVAVGLALLNQGRAIALPPKDQVPEEILRTEIITTARSPLSGAPLSAADYATLQEKLQQPSSPQASGNLARLIMLLKLRRVLKPLLPVF